MLKVKKVPQAPRIFHSLMLQEMALIRSMARSLTTKQEDTDDLIQDTWEKALETASKWRGSDFRSWLFRLMQGTLMSKMRRENRLIAVIEESYALMHSNDRLSDQEMAVHVSDVRKAIARLPAHMQATMILLGTLERTLSEGAAVTEVSLGTYKSRRSRARRRLRSELHIGERFFDEVTPFAG